MEISSNLMLWLVSPLWSNGSSVCLRGGGTSLYLKLHFLGTEGAESLSLFLSFILCVFVRMHACVRVSVCLCLWVHLIFETKSLTKSGAYWFQLGYLASNLQGSLPVPVSCPSVLGCHTVLTVIKVERQKPVICGVYFYFSSSLAISWSFACPYNFRSSLLVFMKKQYGVLLEIQTWKSAWRDLVS